jgi:hypothetical protein
MLLERVHWVVSATVAVLLCGNVRVQYLQGGFSKGAATEVLPIDHCQAHGLDKPSRRALQHLDFTAGGGVRFIGIGEKDSLHGRSGPCREALLGYLSRAGVTSWLHCQISASPRSDLVESLVVT